MDSASLSMLLTSEESRPNGALSVRSFNVSGFGEFLLVGLEGVRDHGRHLLGDFPHVVCGQMSVAQGRNRVAVAQQPVDQVQEDTFGTFSRGAFASSFSGTLTRSLS